MVSLECDSLVVFPYLSASWIWPDNRDGVWSLRALLEGDYYRLSLTLSYIYYEISFDIEVYLDLSIIII